MVSLPLRKESPSNPNQNEVVFNKSSFINFTKEREFISYYEVIKLIGEGSFGKVFRVRNKQTNEIRAMKQLTKAKITDLSWFKNEIQILSKIDHPNIIKLYEIFEEERYFFLIFEECVGGELIERIIQKCKDQKPFTEKAAARIFDQLMSAISYCHDNKICHRDLKPENILFLTTEENSPIKIIDFGYSRTFIPKTSNNGKTEMSSKVGTIYYVSPEVWQGKYNELCDIWSCGVILYLMLCGYFPFYGKTDKEVYERIAEQKFTFPDNEWKKLSKDVKDLLKKMIVSPDKRLTAAQVWNHRWVKHCAPGSSGEPWQDLDIASMQNYQNCNKLKKAVLTFIASRWNEKEVLKIKSMFQAFDKDKNGTITIDELKNGLGQSWASDQDSEAFNWKIQELFDSIDTDKSGKIDYTEFLAATMDKQIYLQEEKLYEAFKVFDKDNVGKITVKEIKSVLNINNDNDNKYIEAIVKEHDLNGDGKIDYNEFLEMMKKK